MFRFAAFASICVMMLACGMESWCAGGTECVNEPPPPGCTQVSSWVTLPPGFGGAASLSVAVDTSNGNARVGFRAGGAFPCGRELTFWHNSRDSRAYPAGVGRNHSFNVMLLEHPDEWHPVTVRIVLANGYRIGFDENLDGTFRGEPGVFSRLFKEADGSYRLYTNDSPDMTDDGQVCYTFGPADSVGRCRLLSVATAAGTFSFTYVASGNGVGEVYRVREDATGREAVFAYDASNRLTSVTSMDQVTTTISYNASGDVSAVEGPWGALTFGYDQNHNVTLVTDGLEGHCASLAYISSARAVEFRDTAAQTSSFTYTVGSTDSVISTVYNGYGQPAVTYDFTPNHLVAAVSQPGVPRMCYTYNADKCLIGQTTCSSLKGPLMASAP